MKVPSLLIASILLTLFALVSCSNEDPKKSARGFRLPDGDVDKGKAAFVAMQCNQCHTVSGVELPEYEGDSPHELSLGGSVLRVKSYGQLVTSIINPSHVISQKYIAQQGAEEGDGADADGKSPMPSFNDKMTVAQMIDIVSFLQSRYMKLEPEYDPYETMGP